MTGTPAGHNREGFMMSQSMDARGFRRDGMVTRRRLLRWSAAGSAVGFGATMLAAAPWRAAFGEAKPYKNGTMQPVSRSAAIIGKAALGRVPMAVDRLNKR